MKGSPPIVTYDDGPTRGVAAVPMKPGTYPIASDDDAPGTRSVAFHRVQQSGSALARRVR